MSATIAKLRHCVPIIAMVAVLALAVACNNANAFADKYADFLSSQTAVETYRVRPNNSLPTAESVDTSVTLRAGLSVDEIAAAIRTLSTHRIDEKVGEHRIRVTFTADNAASQRAAITLIVIPGSTNPRTGDPSTVRHWVDRAREMVATGPSITELAMWTDAVSVDTAAAAFPAAQSLEKFIDAEPAGLVRLSASGPDCVVQWDLGDRLEDLAPYRELIALLPAGVVPAHCRASSQKPLTEPSFYVTVPRDTPPQTIADMRERAAQLGLAAEITIAA